MNSARLKEWLRKGKVAVGTWVFEFNSPGVARLLAATGIDFLVYDMEHSGFGIECIRTQAPQARAADVAPLVRPPAAQYQLIAPVLDVGAGGIIAPMVQDASDAKTLSGACRYHPDGHRGAAFSISHDDFRPGDVARKMKEANEAVICSALIETKRAVDNIDEILDVPGIDLVWVGHFDLSLTLGIPAEFDRPEFLEAVNRIVKSCELHRIPVGIMVNDVEQAKQRVQQGFRCLSYSGDIWLLQRALSEGVQALRMEFPGA